MPNRKELLWSAGELARFANVESPQDLERFRANNPGFFPPHFWNEFNFRGGVAWEKLPEPTGVGFNPFEGTEAYGPSGPLVGTTWIRLWGLRDSVRSAWKLAFPIDHCIFLLSFVQVIPDKSGFRPWPFQRAVMFFGAESWRARFCSGCGRCFVAEQPATRFCSIRCAAEGRRASKKAWWAKDGKKWRKEIQGKKRGRKAKGNSQRRTGRGKRRSR